MKNISKGTKRIATVSILISVAFVLSWIEMALSLLIPVYGQYGMKIGLANLAVLFTMYFCGESEAAMVLTGRLLLNAMLFGNVNSLIYSIAGGVLSFGVMAISKRIFPKQIIYISIIGGLMHNIGQMLAASWIMKTMLWWLLPYLVVCGIAAGAFTGLTAKKMLSFEWFEKRAKTKLSEQR